MWHRHARWPPNGNSSSGGNAAEERCGDITQSLTQQFAVGVMFCRSFLSSTTAQSSDSIAPSIAIENAAGIRAVNGGPAEHKLLPSGGW